MHARLRYEQTQRCAAGVHRWLGWGNWHPVMELYRIEPVLPSEAPTAEPMKAIRDRQCLACGARERENYQGKRWMLQHD